MYWCCNHHISDCLFSSSSASSGWTRRRKRRSFGLRSHTIITWLVGKGGVGGHMTLNWLGQSMKKKRRGSRILCAIPVWWSLTRSKWIKKSFIALYYWYVEIHHSTISVFFFFSRSTWKQLNEHQDCLFACVFYACVFLWPQNSWLCDCSKTRKPANTKENNK